MLMVKNKSLWLISEVKPPHHGRFSAIKCNKNRASANNPDHYGSFCILFYWQRSCLWKWAGDIVMQALNRCFQTGNKESLNRIISVKMRFGPMCWTTFHQQNQTTEYRSSFRQLLTSPSQKYWSCFCSSFAKLANTTSIFTHLWPICAVYAWFQITSPPVPEPRSTGYHIVH